MFNLNDITIFIALSVLFLLLAIGYGIVYFRYKRVSAHYLQAALERDLFREKLSEYATHKESKKIEHTEGFIRFISQSRDWAFKYIEDTQDAIKIFDEEVGDIVREYKKTGKAPGRSQKPLLDKLVIAYDVVMSLMPEDN